MSSQVLNQKSDKARLRVRLSLRLSVKEVNQFSSFKRPTHFVSSFEIKYQGSNRYRWKNDNHEIRRLNKELKATFMYSTKLESRSWFPSCTSFSVEPSASTENSPFHFSNSNAAASSSLAFWAWASSSYVNEDQILQLRNATIDRDRNIPNFQQHRKWGTITHQLTLQCLTLLIFLPPLFSIIVLFRFPRLPWSLFGLNTINLRRYKTYLALQLQNKGK